MKSNPYGTKNYFDMMANVYQKPQGHSEGKKPYFADSYFAMEYPELVGYAAGGDIITAAVTPPVTDECLAWFEKTVIVSGNDFYSNPAFIDSLTTSLDACTKLRLIIMGCMQYNSLSFCLCCASLNYTGGRWVWNIAGQCDQDFGATGDEDWNCCAGACPDFSIQEMVGPGSSVCYKATTGACETRVYWEKNLDNAGWIPMPSECTERPGCRGTIRATDLCDHIRTIPISGVQVTGVIGCTSAPCNEITKSSSKQYTYTPCACATGDPVWSVTGTGASITQGGLLSTTSAACGMLEIKVHQEGCKDTAKAVRVTNGGTWVLVSSVTNMATIPGDCSGISLCRSLTSSVVCTITITDSTYEEWLGGLYPACILAACGSVDCAPTYTYVGKRLYEWRCA